MDLGLGESPLSGHFAARELAALDEPLDLRGIDVQVSGEAFEIEVVVGHDCVRIGWWLAHCIALRAGKRIRCGQQGHGGGQVPLWLAWSVGNWKGKENHDDLAARRGEGFARRGARQNTLDQEGFGAATFGRSREKQF